jgi:NAD(P)-dependent dehydrogenase (short-subunit alcohol dehydrogenase family)
MSKPVPRVLFILGGGPRIGYSVAKRFVREGYKVAIGRRTPAGAEDHKDLEGVFFVAVDVSSRDSIRLAFGEVTAKLGIPNVVVYNGEICSSTGWEDTVCLC